MDLLKHHVEAGRDGYKSLGSKIQAGSCIQKRSPNLQNCEEPILRIAQADLRVSRSSTLRTWGVLPKKNTLQMSDSGKRQIHASVGFRVKV